MNYVKFNLFLCGINFGMAIVNFVHGNVGVGIFNLAVGGLCGYIYLDISDWSGQ